MQNFIQLDWKFSTSIQFNLKFPNLIQFDWKFTTSIQLNWKMSNSIELKNSIREFQLRFNLTENFKFNWKIQLDLIHKFQSQLN